MRTRASWVGAVVAALAGCGEDEPIAREDDAPGRVTQAEWTYYLGADWPELFVLIVDDGATEDAAELRDGVATAMEGYEQERQSRLGGCDARHDPVHWEPIERRAVIVRPSQAGDARLTTWLEDPALAWVANDRTPEDDARWAAAVRRGLEPPANPPGGYHLLEAAWDTAQLLARQRPSEIAREQALVEVVESNPMEVVFVVATTRDDESPLSATSYDRAPLAADAYSGWWLLAPSSSPCESYSQPELTSPRLATWAKEGSDMLSVQGWPCETLDLFPFHASGSCRTRNRPILLDEDGRAACRVEVVSREIDACPAELGWADPLGDDGVRHPSTEPFEAGWPRAVRRCEILQLEGEALTACHRTVACEGCGPGWCWSEVWCDLFHLAWTRDDGYFPGMRFVHGADSVRGHYRFTCNLGDATP